MIATEMAKWEEMMPIEEMNLEEALEVVPHLVIDGKNPNFWPHDQDMDEWRNTLPSSRRREELAIIKLVFIFE